MKGCFVCKTGGRLDYVYDNRRKEEIAKRLDMLPEVINSDNLALHKDALNDVEAIFATWDMEPFTAEQLEEYFPALKYMFYAAGSVRYFAEPFLQRGARILSAWGAMAIPVAEYTLGAILHANKGFYLAMSRYRSKSFEEGQRIATIVNPGTYGTKVGILGAGMIGGNVIRLLKNHNVDIMVFDPFMSDEKASALGVVHSPLEEIFAQCHTISNHLANNPQTVGMLNYDLFKLMPKNAAFINTGRGAQVVEADLVRALTEEPDRCALLDVTFPEPCPDYHTFWGMDNVFLTPHIAGFAGDEVLSFSDCMIEELDRLQSGQPFQWEVTLPMLKTMA